jgi:hypothetical protein
VRVLVIGAADVAVSAIYKSRSVQRVRPPVVDPLIRERTVFNDRGGTPASAAPIALAALWSFLGSI